MGGIYTAKTHFFTDREGESEDDSALVLVEMFEGHSNDP